MHPFGIVSLFIFGTPTRKTCAPIKLLDAPGKKDDAPAAIFSAPMLYRYALNNESQPSGETDVRQTRTIEARDSDAAERSLGLYRRRAPLFTHIGSI